MTHREILYRVKTHLLTQKAKSRRTERAFTGEGLCAYRGDNGLKCAIGCLISDFAYSPSLEGRGVGFGCVMDALKASSVTTGNPNDVSFFKHLQGIHDDKDVQDWEKAFNYLESMLDDQGWYPTSEDLSL